MLIHQMIIWGSIGLMLNMSARVGYATPYEFWAHWSDGEAEVNTYALTQPRYGEPRSGVTHLIYVTEPFSKAKRVKVDRYDQGHPDHTIALKLNIVESWRTGVYEYRLMSSHFFDALDGLKPLKSTFSAQEWCGVSFEESLWSEGGLSVDKKSYFEGESGAHHFSTSARFTDQLLVLARGLLSGDPKAITQAPLQLIESPKRRFLTHRPPLPYEGAVSLKPVEELKTPLGPVKVYPMSYSLKGGVGCVVEVEVESPHRVMGWRCEDGEHATLIESKRSAYWRHTQRADQGR